MTEKRSKIFIGIFNDRLLYCRIACIFGILISYIWIAFQATHSDLPSFASPILFYSNQNRQDLKAVLTTAISKAKESIKIKMYGLTDPNLLRLLRKKAESGLSISIEYDSSASFALNDQLGPLVHARPSSCKGLMHKKILVIDEATVFLGSANMTPSSLSFHDNLLIGIFHPDLAKHCIDPTKSFYSFSVGQQEAELWLLPDHENRALDRVLGLIQEAKKSISLAIFTLTHPRLIQALIAKKQEGVKVECALDFYTGRGASSKALQLLKEAKIPVYLSRGQELFHHKWALIDKKILIAGSANWTKAAFRKNEDCLIILKDLKKTQKKFLNNIWNIVKLETIEYGEHYGCIFYCSFSFYLDGSNWKHSYFYLPPQKFRC